MSDGLATRHKLGFWLMGAGAQLLAGDALAHWLAQWPNRVVVGQLVARAWNAHLNATLADEAKREQARKPGKKAGTVVQR